MADRYYYEEQIYFIEEHNKGLIEINQRKIVEMLQNNHAVGVVSGFYEEGYPLYFISHFMLSGLNYDSFEEFMENTGGNFIEAVFPDDRSFFEEGIKDGPREREYRILNKKGEYVWINEVRTESHTYDGRILWIGSVRFVDDKHEAKKEFVSTISHDVRTPLNAIIGMANLAKLNMDKPEKLKEYLDVIVESGYNLLGEINEVLELSDIEAGVLYLNNTNFDLKELVNEAISLIDGEVKAKQQDILVRYINVTDTKVVSDRDNLLKVFVNILDNANKYSDVGGKIELNVEEIKNDGENVIFRIDFRDYGSGINEYMIKYVFEPFERASDSRKSGDVPHIGLGLPITRNIVNFMGGNLTVESTQGEGSCFTLVQPMKLQSKFDLQRAVGDIGIENMKILVVDDNDVNRELLCEYLAMERAVCVEAVNGLEAVNIFEAADDLDAILMDIHMPVMDGYEATDIIREKSNIPIIAVTADSGPQDVREALDHKMNGHMSKPIDFEQLKATLMFWRYNGKA